MSGSVLLNYSTAGFMADASRPDIGHLFCCQLRGDLLWPFQFCSEVFCRPIIQQDAGSCSAVSSESWFYGWCLTPQHIWRLFGCQLQLKFSTAPNRCVSQLREWSVFFFFFRLALEIGVVNMLSTAVTCWLLYQWWRVSISRLTRWINQIIMSCQRLIYSGNRYSETLSDSVVHFCTKA